MKKKLMDFKIKYLIFSGSIFLCSSLLAIITPVKSSTQSIILACPPKSGTHLIDKLVKLLTGLKSKSPPAISEIKTDHISAIISDNKFCFTHAAGTHENFEGALNNQAKVIVLLRDPRDVLPSYAHYLKKESAKPTFNGFGLEPEWPKISHLSEEDIITHFIERYPTRGPRIPEYNTIVDFYKLYLQWGNYPDVYITSFEKLVGKQGGGNEINQLTEVIEIAKFIGRPINKEKARTVCSKLFGGTNTFMKGEIGSWRINLTNKHKEALKNMKGFNELLIELGYEKDDKW